MDTICLFDTVTSLRTRMAGSQVGDRQAAIHRALAEVDPRFAEGGSWDINQLERIAELETNLENIGAITGQIKQGKNKGKLIVEANPRIHGAQGSRENIIADIMQLQQLESGEASLVEHLGRSAANNARLESEIRDLVSPTFIKGIGGAGLGKGRVERLEAARGSAFTPEEQYDRGLHLLVDGSKGIDHFTGAPITSIPTDAGHVVPMDVAPEKGADIDNIFWQGSYQNKSLQKLTDKEEQIERMKNKLLADARAGIAQMPDIGYTPEGQAAIASGPWIMEVPNPDGTQGGYSKNVTRAKHAAKKLGLDIYRDPKPVDLVVDYL